MVGDWAIGAIAAIRTVLNYFLGRDIREFGESEREAAVEQAGELAKE